MTNQQAEAKAKKLWGKSYYIRNSGSMSSQEKRSEHRERSKAARAEMDAIEADIKKRLSEVDWYVELRRRQHELRKEINAAQSNALHYRFSVGKTGSMFTEILGQGDTWEEAFAAAAG